MVGWITLKGNFSHNVGNPIIHLALALWSWQIAPNYGDFGYGLFLGLPHKP